MPFNLALGFFATASRSCEAVVFIGVGIEPGAVPPGRRDPRKVVEGHPSGPVLVTQHGSMHGLHEAVRFDVVRREVEPVIVVPERVTGKDASANSQTYHFKIKNIDLGRSLYVRSQAHRQACSYMVHISKEDFMGANEMD